MRLLWILRCLAVGFFAVCLFGCASLWRAPKQTTISERFNQFPAQSIWPVSGKVQVSFREGMIPFVEADTDADCAFAIGVVHAYLRLGQMELFRRGSAGRLSESAGALGTSQIDAFIRRLDLGRAAEKSLELMSASDRMWLTRYIEGINFFLQETDELPYEFSFLNFKKETWTEKDAFRISRLAGADVNWGVLLGLLELQKEAGADRLWQEVLSGAQSSFPSVSTQQNSALDQLLRHSARSGSNSVVVSGRKSQSGSPILASDPHLGVFAPNLWLLMGYRCPSYEVVGLMLPGVPTVTLGRNSHSAWGGTYMRATSSHLFAVEPEQILVEREERIHRRNWFSRTVKIKESVHGPVVFESQDAKQSPMVALSWVGHQPSNEIGAFLAVNRAKSFQEFRASFQNYGVSGLNMTYADRKGDIGLVPAVGQPLLKKPEYKQLIKSSDNSIERIRSVQELPYGLNPAQGILVSANNQPVQVQPPLAYSSGENDRVRRWTDLLSSAKSMKSQDLMAFQQDVYSTESHELAKLYVSSLSPSQVPPALRGYLHRIQTWDGRYAVESQGAVAFEFLTYQLARDFGRLEFSSEKVRDRFLARDTWRSWVFTKLKTLSLEKRQELILKAMTETWDHVQNVKNWGAQHPQPIQTPLGLIPLLGSRFRFGEFPSPGSATTIYKANFTPSLKQTPVIFGAQSRHISDLADPDENYFVLLGGNDGWLITENLTNQVGLWQKGEFLRIPLSREAVKREFRLKQFTIQPKAAQP